MPAGPYELLGIGGISSGMKQFYSKKLLSRVIPNLVHLQYGMKDGIPRNGGRSVEWRRYDRPAVTTTALTEGTPGAVTRVSMATVTATVSQYGAYAHYSDVLSLQNIDDFVDSYIPVFSEQMAISLDTVVRDVMVAGTTIQYASVAATRGGASGVGSGMLLNFAEIREAVSTLRANDAPGFPELGGRYVGIIRPETEYDLFGNADILQSLQQAGPRGGNNPIMTGELGDFYGIHWVTTSRAATQDSLGLSNVDVYLTLIFGREYYGVLDYESMRSEVIVKPVGSAGSEDPLNQVGSIGWKANITAARLDEARAVRIEHSVTTDQALK